MPLCCRRVWDQDAGSRMAAFQGERMFGGGRVPARGDGSGAARVAARGRQPPSVRAVPRWPACLALGLVLVLLACSSSKTLLRIDVTGDRVFSGVSLRLTVGTAAAKTFAPVTFGPAQAYRAGV